MNYSFYTKIRNLQNAGVFVSTRRNMGTDRNTHSYGVSHMKLKNIATMHLDGNDLETLVVDMNIHVPFCQFILFQLKYCITGYLE